MVIVSTIMPLAKVKSTQAFGVAPFNRLDNSFLYAVSFVLALFDGFSCESIGVDPPEYCAVIKW